MDVNFIVQHIPQYVDAAFLTLRLATIGIFLSLLLGLFCSLLIYFKIPVGRQICSLYIELSRNTPLLVRFQKMEDKKAVKREAFVLWFSFYSSFSGSKGVS